MIYLASPYSSGFASVREERYHEVCKAAARLMITGKIVYSPIAHSHPIEHYTGPQDHGFWMHQCVGMLRHCDEIVVLMIDGWKESKGVAIEVELANTLDIPVRYIDP